MNHTLQVHNHSKVLFNSKELVKTKKFNSVIGDMLELGVNSKMYLEILDGKKSFSIYGNNSW